MIDGTAVEKIAELAREGQSVEQLTGQIGEHVFSTEQLHHLPPKPENEPTPLLFNTLKALAEYIAAARDGVDLSKCVILVHDPQKVGLYGPLTGEKRQRFCYATAACTDLAAKFVGLVHDQENFVVAMQSRFVDMGDRADVLAVISKLKQEQAIEQEDDGVSQRVTAKSGVVLAQQIALPNPVTLAPYRTFREVEQPSSRFVLRVVSGPKIGLFEADGGAWGIEAVERVATWLQANTSGLPVLR